MSSARLPWIDIAKALAVAAIVLVHTDASLSVERASGLGAAASMSLGVLFLVSGFVVRNDVVGERATGRTVANRMVGLLWLYVLWSPVVVAHRLLTSLADGRVDLSGEVLRFLAVPVRPSGELWYLWALAVHLLVTFWTRRAPAAVVLVPALAVFVTVQGWGKDVLGGQTWHLLGPGLQGLPQFALLTLLGARTPGVITRISALRTRCALLLAAGTWSFVATLQTLHPPHIAPATTLIGVVATLATARSLLAFPWGRALAWAGSRSIAPYLLHMLVIAVLVIALGGRPPVAMGPAERTAAAGLVFTAAVAVPLVVHRWTAGTKLQWVFRVPPALLSVLGRWSTPRAHSGRVSRPCVGRSANRPR
ncbi:acyltransferase [Curtobacterium sp. MCSS17_007]|uniref:acyltransferase family protein n=1 Tax=Curtobacterium sp. MCSS17_007 TaxID=2175646 RepID=UPI0015E8E069|nr:acyltransferase [Curtobacterium sp. MCSS17_007]WIE76067.1 acyltransferase [Curtobacterium sp. MCSS17_007]